MILRPKINNRFDAQSADAVVASGNAPRASSGARGWRAVVSPAGSTTLWRPRGRIASGADSRRPALGEMAARTTVSR